MQCDRAQGEHGDRGPGSTDLGQEEDVPSLVRSALNKLCLRHPIVGCAIQDDREEYLKRVKSYQMPTQGDGRQLSGVLRLQNYVAGQYDQDTRLESVQAPRGARTGPKGAQSGLLYGPAAECLHHRLAAAQEALLPRQWHRIIVSGDSGMTASQAH